MKDTLSVNTLHGIQSHAKLSFAKLDNGSRRDIANPTDQIYAAFGWEREHIQLAEQMACNGARTYSFPWT